MQLLQVRTLCPTIGRDQGEGAVQSGVAVSYIEVTCTSYLKGLLFAFDEEEKDIDRCCVYRSRKKDIGRRSREGRQKKLIALRMVAECAHEKDFDEGGCSEILTGRDISRGLRHSFIHSGYFYSASSSGTHGTPWDMVAPWLSR